MNKTEYTAQRKELISKAEALLENKQLSESERVEAFNKVEAEIKSLDAQFQDTATKMANFRAEHSPQQPTPHFFQGGPKIPTAEYQTPDGREIKAYRKTDSLVNHYPNTNNMSLGKYLKGAITGDWKNASVEMDAFKALSTATTQVLIPQVLSAQVIDLARNKSVLFQSGAPMITMETNNLTISKVKTDPTFAFKAEGEAAEEAVMEFEGVELKSKTAYGLMSVTLEAMNSSANLESTVTHAMSEALAKLIDSKALFGSTPEEPKGILTYTTINEIAAGEITNYTPFVQAISQIRRANGEPTAWAMNAATDEYLNLLVDANGNPLGIPRAVDNLERLVSNQLPDNEGTGQDESTSMIYDPEALLIGMQTPLMVEISREALDAWQKGLVYLRVYAMMDIALLRPTWVTKIHGIKEQAPAV